MSDFLKQYQKEFEKEVTQFLFLCGKEDGKMLIDKKTDAAELVRLACISLVFGYKKVFLKIAATADKNVDEFLETLENTGGNFAQICNWTNEFIENIENSKAKELSREFWLERKKTLDRENFTVKQLLF